MSITDELRNHARLYEQHRRAHIERIADSIDAAYEEALREAYMKGRNDGFDRGYASADDWCAQHEDAMAEHGWVRGPLDKDGKMWRSGDMSDSNWGEIDGIVYENGKWFISGHDTSAPWIPADSIGHYKPPTVEDVLDEFASAYDRIGGEDEEHQKYLDLIAEYAKRLRLAGSDAE